MASQIPSRGDGGESSRLVYTHLTNWAQRFAPLTESRPFTLPLPSAPSPETFHSFIKLPAELQLQIWRCVLQHCPPRIIELSYTSGHWFPRYTKLEAQSVPLLSVCHDSRTVAQEGIVLVFMVFISTTQARIYHISHTPISCGADTCRKLVVGITIVSLTKMLSTSPSFSRL